MMSFLQLEPSDWTAEQAGLIISPDVNLYKEKSQNRVLFADIDNLDAPMPVRSAL